MKSIFVLLFAGVIFGCSNTPTKQEVMGTSNSSAQPETISIESKQIAVEQKADYVTELKFNRRQSVLTSAQKKQIVDKLKMAESRGTLQEVKIVSWADKDYPSEEKKTLSGSQVKIAEQRNLAIEEFLKTTRQDMKIRTYSMAERASAFKEFIGSSEARIKKSLETAGIAVNEDQSGNRSLASKAIVLFLVD